MTEFERLVARLTKFSNRDLRASGEGPAAAIGALKASGWNVELVTERFDEAAKAALALKKAARRPRKKRQTSRDVEAAFEAMLAASQAHAP